MTNRLVFALKIRQEALDEYFLLLEKTMRNADSKPVLSPEDATAAITALSGIVGKQNDLITMLYGQLTKNEDWTR